MVMAVREITFQCDHCGYADEEAEYRSVEEALENGWFIVRGPERMLGGDGERVFCDRDCMVANL